MTNRENKLKNERYYQTMFLRMSYSLQNPYWKYQHRNYLPHVVIFPVDHCLVFAFDVFWCIEFIWNHKPHEGIIRTVSCGRKIKLNKVTAIKLKFSCQIWIKIMTSKGSSPLNFKTVLGIPPSNLLMILLTNQRIILPFDSCAYVSKTKLTVHCVKLFEIQSKYSPFRPKLPVDFDIWRIVKLRIRTEWVNDAYVASKQKETLHV